MKQCEGNLPTPHALTYTGVCGTVPWFANQAAATSYPMPDTILTLSASPHLREALATTGISCLSFPDDLRGKRPRAETYLLVLDVSEPGYLTHLADFAARPLEPWSAVLVGDANDAEVARNAMRERVVTSYVAREELANPATLRRELERAASAALATSAASKEYARLHRLAYTDPLTGIENRTAWNEYLTSLAAEPAPVTVGLALFDLQGFKQVNDQYGQQAGDRALQTFAQALRKSVRRSDRVYRHGGDEFAAIFPLNQDASVALPAITQKLTTGLSAVAVPETDLSVRARFVLLGTTLDRAGDVEGAYAELSAALSAQKAAEKSQKS